jgi:hypothetical protein
MLAVEQPVKIRAVMDLSSPERKGSPVMMLFMRMPLNMFTWLLSPLVIQSWTAGKTASCGNGTWLTHTRIYLLPYQIYDFKVLVD